MTASKHEQTKKMGNGT